MACGSALALARRGRRGAQRVADIQQRLADSRHSSQRRRVERTGDLRAWYRPVAEPLAPLARRASARKARVGVPGGGALSGSAVGCACLRTLRRCDRPLAVRERHQPVLGSSVRSRCRRHVRIRSEPVVGRRRRPRSGDRPCAHLSSGSLGAAAHQRCRRPAACALGVGRRGGWCARVVGGPGHRCASPADHWIRPARRTDLRARRERVRRRDDRCRHAGARAAAAAAVQPGTGQWRGRVPRLPRVLRRRELGSAGVRSGACRQPAGSRSRHPRHRPLGRVRARSLDDLRR